MRKILSGLYGIFFEDIRMSWFWFLVRLYVGWEWLYAGYEKLVNPAGVWVGAKSGVAISGFVNGALAKTTGMHPDVTTWYAWFLQHSVAPYANAWSYAITYGEMLVGLGLIFGVFTVTAAFFGALMNTNYLLSGTVSSNPILLLLAIGIMMAHKVSGHIGLDRYVSRAKHSWAMFR